MTAPLIRRKKKKDTRRRIPGSPGYPRTYTPRDHALTKPIRGRIRLTVAELAISRGHVGKGKYQGYPALQAIMRGSGASYTRLFELLRRPERVQNITIKMLLKLCSFFECQPGDLIRYDAWAPPINAPDLPPTPLRDSFALGLSSPLSRQGSHSSDGLIKEGEALSSPLAREDLTLIKEGNSLSSALAGEQQPGVVSKETVLTELGL